MKNLLFNILNVLDLELQILIDLICQDMSTNDRKYLVNVTCTTGRRQWVQVWQGEKTKEKNGGKDNTLFPLHYTIEVAT